MQKVSCVLFSLQRPVDQGVRLILADIINELANCLFADFKRVIANDEVSCLVDGHGAPPKSKHHTTIIGNNIFLFNIDDGMRKSTANCIRHTVKTSPRRKSYDLNDS